MGTKNVLLQANHGPIVAAVDVATAWWYLYYLERAAKLTLAAMSTGKPLRTISDKVSCHLYQDSDLASHLTSPWGALAVGFCPNHAWHSQENPRFFPKLEKIKFILPGF